MSEYRYNDPQLIMRGIADYIAFIGAIPLHWLTTHWQYDPCNNRILVRIDCMEVTYSSRFDCVENQAKEAEKLLPEIDRFIMLLWGEPA